MSEHDPTHPRWEVPPADPTPDAGTGAAAAALSSSGPKSPSGGTQRRRWRHTIRGRAVRGRRGLVAAAVGVAVVLGGGAAGIAAAADDGPDRNGAVVMTDDGGGRADRGGADGPRDQGD